MTGTIRSTAAGLILGALAAAPPAEAQNAPVYVYALTNDGKLTVNGTVLETMGSNYGWAELVVVGSDRYALQRDGRIRKNGEKFEDLEAGYYWPFFWNGMAVDGGNVYCIRQDGEIGVNNDEVDTLPLGDFPFFFRDVIAKDGEVYFLRTDGSVYRNGSNDRVFRFNASSGVGGYQDGYDIDTLWVTIRRSPDNPNFIYGLRSDGNLYVGSVLSDEDPQAVASLPFPDDWPLETEDFYVDLEFTADGKWKVLRANGEVFSAEAPLASIVDYPGSASDTDNTFYDIAVLEDNFVAVRGDGKIYANRNETEILDAPGGGYVLLALSRDPPNLDNIKNLKPVVAKYTTTTLPGTPISIPVVASDTEKATADLVVTLLDPLPPGATWDEGTRTFAWANPGPKGNYKFTFTVEDGTNKAVKGTYSVKVKDPDAKPDKNKKPYISKISKVQVVIGQELRFPIIVDDPDGDPVSVSVDPTAYPFTAGASFSPSTKEFVWNPQYTDLGKVDVQFVASDGIDTTTLKVKIEVVSGFIIEQVDNPPPEAP